MSYICIEAQALWSRRSRFKELLNCVKEGMQLVIRGNSSRWQLRAFVRLWWMTERVENSIFKVLLEIYIVFH
jgi:hypothetical protein